MKNKFLIKFICQNSILSFFFFSFLLEKLTMMISNKLGIFLPNLEIKIYVYIYVGPKNLATLVHFISSSKPTPKRKKCPRTNEEGPNCQETLPRTIMFSANRDHGRKKWHTTKDILPEHPKGKHKCNESAMRV